MFAIFIALVTALLPPCASEYETNCYWDASVQGNGIGVSFVDIFGATYYTDK